MMESRQEIEQTEKRTKKKAAGAKLRVSGLYRVATILKDRSTQLDGKSFRDPTFADFLPHIERLAFGSPHEAIEQRDNSELFAGRGEQTKYAKERQEKEIVLEEIGELMKKHHGGQDAGSKAEGSLHSLRHSFAANLVLANVSLRVIQRLMGHATIKTTEQYAHVAESALKGAVGGLQL